MLAVSKLKWANTMWLALAKLILRVDDEPLVSAFGCNEQIVECSENNNKLD